MLLKITFSETKDFITLYIDDKYSKYFKIALPFNSVIKLWKEEIYFTTPVNIEVSTKDLISKVKAGWICYWPPGRALCIFYGLSQPYTPVLKIGEYPGPLHTLYDIEEDLKIRVEHYELPSIFANVIKILHDQGFNYIGTIMKNGEEYLIASKYVKDLRFSVILSIEDFGVYVETDGMCPYYPCPYIESLVYNLKNHVLNKYNDIRLDLSENLDFICLTACCKSIEDLKTILNTLEIAYLDVINFIASKL